MNSRKNSDNVAREILRLRVFSVLVVALPLLLGGISFSIAYFLDVNLLYFVASAMGLVAIGLGGKVNDFKHQIQEKEAELEQLR